MRRGCNYERPRIKERLTWRRKPTTQRIAVPAFDRWIWKRQLIISLITECGIVRMQRCVTRPFGYAVLAQYRQWMHVRALSMGDLNWMIAMLSR